jgi:hypothetical protein
MFLRKLKHGFDSLTPPVDLNARRREILFHQTPHIALQNETASLDQLRKFVRDFEGDPHEESVAENAVELHAEGSRAIQPVPLGNADSAWAMGGSPALSGSIPFGDFSSMDALNGAGLGARRNEDIALDLLKFVAATAGVGRPAAPSAGFSTSGSTKPEEHVNQLLDLYSRCLKTVEGEDSETGASK